VRRSVFPGRLSNVRLWLSVAGVVLGLAAWVCGIRSAFGETSWLSLLANPLGLVLFLCSALSLIRLTLERRLYNELLANPALAPQLSTASAPTIETEPAEAVLFTLMLGGGVALLGIAIAGVLAPIPTVALGVVAVALVAFSPKAMQSSWIPPLAPARRLPR
jgi:hypothetical protein